MRKIRRYKRINGKLKRCSHIAWHAHTGHWPDYPNEVVHHINGDTTDNRIENLQLMSHIEHACFHALGKTPSEETRAKISASMMGENNPMKKSEVRAKFKGKNNPMYGMTGEDSPNWKGDDVTPDAKYRRALKARKEQEVQSSA